MFWGRLGEDLFGGDVIGILKVLVVFVGSRGRALSVVEFKLVRCVVVFEVSVGVVMV